MHREKGIEGDLRNQAPFEIEFVVPKFSAPTHRTMKQKRGTS